MLLLDRKAVKEIRGGFGPSDLGDDAEDIDAVRKLLKVAVNQHHRAVDEGEGLGNDRVAEIVSDSLIIAATNHATILDRALFRRFDDIINYSLPTAEQITAVLKAKLAGFKSGRIEWSKLAKAAQGLSYGGLTRAVEDAVKHAIIERHAVNNADLAAAIAERRTAANPAGPKRKRS